MVEFADSLELFLELLEVVEPLANLGFHFRAETVLLVDSSGIADGEDQNRMAFATSALGATAFVTDGAMEKATAKDLLHGGQRGSQFLALVDGLLVFHQYY